MRVHKPPSKRDIEQLRAELEAIKQRLAQIDASIDDKLTAKPAIDNLP